MKNIVLLFLIGFLTIKSYSQKKEIYLNDDLESISESEFKEKKEPFSYNIKYDLDTIIVNVKALRIKKGLISKQKLDSIKNNISKVSGKTIKESDMIVINYYPGLDNCNSSYSNPFLREKYSQYLKEIKKNENVSQFFIYKTIEGTEKYGKKLEWFPDNGNVIKNIFFPLHYNCDSFAIIDKNGNFFLTRGEYDILIIIDLINNPEKTFDLNYYQYSH